MSHESDDKKTIPYMNILYSIGWDYIQSLLWFSFQFKKCISLIAKRTSTRPLEQSLSSTYYNRAPKQQNPHTVQDKPKHDRWRQICRFPLKNLAYKKYKYKNQIWHNGNISYFHYFESFFFLTVWINILPKLLYLFQSLPIWILILIFPR